MTESTDIIFDYPEAAALVMAHASSVAPPSRTESLPVGQALGRCLAGAIRADRNQPPFHRSTRDGYAIRAADMALPSIRVIGQLRAGRPPLSKTVAQGEAIEIMTGAPMPAGADAVLMVEHVDVDVALIQPQAGRTLQPGDNVVPEGAEATVGAVIIPAGTRLTPMHIGAAVSSGAARVEVYAQPRIAILATGDELVEPGEPLLPHQIHNSNSYSLAAQVESAGAIPVRLPVARDDMKSIHDSMDAAMEADLVLLSGGVSMGKFDFVEQVLHELNARFLFTGVRMQPGRPVVFGRLRERKYFFGLPGNPVSTMVTFVLFAAPLIRSLGGEQQAGPAFARAHIATDFQHKGGITRFLPALLKTSWNQADVTPIAWQGSGDLAATAQANCFIVIPPDKQQLNRGDEVSVLLAY